MKDEASFFVLLAMSILLIMIVAIRQNIFHDIKDMSRSAAVTAHNIDYGFLPDRRNTLGITGAELSLKQVYPDLFNKFERSDWQEFWDIIYGSHPLIGFKEEAIPAADRNYSLTEVQKVLAQRYPELFSGFNSEHWKIFWKQVFNISPGVQVFFENQDQKTRSDARLDRKIVEDNKKISNTVQGVRKTIGE